ncbi:hypothetical protein FO519_007270, partial [Halicephalobus sp. NKZ332]
MDSWEYDLRDETYRRRNGKRRIAIILAVVVVVCLVIVGIILAITLGTKKKADNSSSTTVTTTETPKRNEVLSIAYNVGYRDNTTLQQTQNDTIKYITELTKDLDFSGNHLSIVLITYADKVIPNNNSYNNLSDVVNAITATKWVPLEDKNPSQEAAVTSYFHPTKLDNSRFVRSIEAAQDQSEAKFCLFSPPISAYAKEDDFKNDARAVGTIINNVAAQSQTAYIAVVSLANNTDDYNLKNASNVMAGTPTDIPAIQNHLNPDALLTTTQAPIVTNPPTTTHKSDTTVQPT